MSAAAVSAPETSPTRGAANDTILLGRVCEGDAEALAQLFDRHGTRVYSVALRILHLGRAAEDVLQEVFMRVWREPDCFRDLGAGLEGSLVLFARNLAIDILHNRRNPDQNIPVVLASRPDVSTWSKSAAVLTQTLTATPSPEAQPSALEMAFFAGKSLDVIAAELGKTPATIKMQIGIALRQRDWTLRNQQAAAKVMTLGAQLDG